MQGHGTPVCEYHVTHPKNVYQSSAVHSGPGCCTLPSMHETLVKRNSDSVEAVEPHAAKHPAGLCIGIIDEH